MCILLYFIVQDGFLTAIEGILFILIITVYLFFTIKESRKDTIASKKSMESDEIPDAPSKQIWRDVVFIILGCVGLYFGSEWFVGSAKDLAISLGVEERVVGLTIVALGTSLPELVTAALASYKGQTDLALGNLMGSNIFNILSILGITSIIQKIQVNQAILNKDIIWMMLITLMILPLLVMRRIVGRIDGLILLIVYTVYIYTVVV